MNRRIFTVIEIEEVTKKPGTNKESEIFYIKNLGTQININKVFSFYKIIFLMMIRIYL